MNLEGIEVPVQDKKELIIYKKILSRDIDLEDTRKIIDMDKLSLD